MRSTGLPVVCIIVSPTTRSAARHRGRRVAELTWQLASRCIYTNGGLAALPSGNADIQLQVQLTLRELVGMT